MTDITPADLAKFVHPVPVGATIPAGMEFVRRYMDGGPTPALAGPIVHDFDIEAAAFSPLWTAEPLTAPKPSLAARARAAAMAARINSDVTLSNLALVVAELADRIEAESDRIEAER